MLGCLFSCVFAIPYYVLSTFAYILYDNVIFLPFVAAAIFIFARMDTDLVTAIYEKVGKSATNLKGQVIWVTGASSGIGAELAVLLAKNGSKLVLSATREGHLEQVKERCLKANGRAKDDDVLVLPLDITDVESHQEKLNKVLEHFGRVDILVNNAGKFQLGLFRETELAVDRSTFEINFFGVINLTRLMVNDWLLKGLKGHLAVTSSVAGVMPGPFTNTYTASKHAVNGYFESIRGELFNRGITVSIVCPGPVVSELMGSSNMPKVGEKGPQVSKKTFDMIMPTKRCAELYAIVLANRLSFAYIVKQPVLFVVCFAECFPKLVRLAMPFFVTEARMAKMAKFED